METHELDADRILSSSCYMIIQLFSVHLTKKEEEEKKISRKLSGISLYGIKVISFVYWLIFTVNRMINELTIILTF